MDKSTANLEQLTAGIPGVSAKIRVLGDAGIPRAEIAKFLGKRYQHVRNVLESDKARSAAKAIVPTPQPEESLTGKVRLGPDGRVVIPAAMRAALNMKEDDVFFARVEDGEIRLATPQRTMQRVSDLLRPFALKGVSLADDLVEERRREAEHEMREIKGG